MKKAIVSGVWLRNPHRADRRPAAKPGAPWSRPDAPVQAELSDAGDRAGGREASLAAVTAELGAIKRSAGWRLTPMRRIANSLQAWLDRRLISRSGLFDRDWYVENCPELRASNFDPIVHYLHNGVAEGRDPNSLFETNWYLEAYPDVRATGLNPLLHYLRYGAAEGRDTGPLFRGDWYLLQNPDVRASGINPLLHYLRHGAREGRYAHPLFDTGWYLRQNADVQAARINPLAHYLRYGGAEGRDPNPLFDGDWYLGQYPDVRAAGINPLVHYLCFGVEEGRNPNPQFDTEWYLRRYPDVQAAGVNPLVDYLHVGAGQGRNPSERFDTEFYLRTNADVSSAGLNPLAHYLQSGAAEGRNPRPVVHRRRRGPIVPDQVDRYEAWLSTNSVGENSVQGLREALATRGGRLPRISVVMPVYNTPDGLLDLAIRSVVDQIYDDWELCIADDASSDPRIAQILRKWSAGDDRVRVRWRDENGGIALAANSAAALATGEFLVFLDHDDILTPDALAEMAIYAVDNPISDVIYSDDDKVDMNGRRFAPQFKPDWSPALLLSYMYVGHLMAIRRSLFQDIGGVRAGFDGSQDYDLALRATELARHVGHIPRILYQWRVTLGSVAASIDEKPRSILAGLEAVADAFARRGMEAIVHWPDWARGAKVGAYSATFPDEGPRVSILIPTRNKLDLLKTCVSSLPKTTYRDYEVVIIDNDSDDPATLQFLSRCGHRVLRVSCPDEKFSFAHINNTAVRQVDSEYVLFLNNDTEVINPRWLSQMLGYARMPGVGAVGAKLLFRDGTVQHNGIVHGYLDGMAGHAFKNVPADDPGHLLCLNVARECSGVTAACLLTPRSLFLEKGGLDTAAFAVAYNDADYCYRLVDSGYRCVVCPDATLYHDEGKSRGFGDDPRELAAFRRRYRGRADPWYNPNLSLENERFEVRPYRRPLPTRQPIRTIAVSHNLNHEGAPNSQFEMITGLQRRGIIEPVVVSPCDGPPRAHYEAAGIPVEAVSPRLGGKVQLDETVKLLARIFRLSGAEVVYANTLQSFWAIAAAEHARIPALWNVRESEPWQTYFDFLPPEVQADAYASFRYPYRVVFVAEATQRAWAPFNGHHNFTTIRNGLDLRRLENGIDARARACERAALGIGGEELAVVLVGTVCERKGQLDLVKAIPLLSAELAGRLRFFIVGDRPCDYGDQLREEAAGLAPDLRDRLAIVPVTGEPYRFFRAADIAVCCSRIESYPRVTLEAMAFGLPMITTPVFGIAEQVRNDVNGLFYQPGDVVGLAGHLTRLATDDGLRSRLASNAPLVLDSLPGLEDMLDGYARLFEEARLTRG
jgi:GT2 family glycosyltransferase